MANTRLHGIDAIDYAITHGKTLSKYTDPTEEARTGLTIAEAEEIASEDAGLIYIDTETAPASAEAWRWAGSEHALPEAEWDGSPLGTRYTADPDGE